MAGGDRFGPSLGPWAVEQAVLDALRKPPPGGLAPRLIYYLADQERQTGLKPRTLPTPPDPAASYRGGVDARTLQPEWFPMLHVNVQPDGAPEKYDMDTYSQSWEITVTATHGADDEDYARFVTMNYGTAVALLIAQYGSLGIGATNTVIGRVAEPELLASVGSRQVCRSVVEFTTLTAPVLRTAGPVDWAFDPYASPGDWPTVTEINVTVDAVPPSQ